MRTVWGCLNEFVLISSAIRFNTEKIKQYFVAISTYIMIVWNGFVEVKEYTS